MLLAGGQGIPCRLADLGKGRNDMRAIIHLFSEYALRQCILRRKSMNERFFQPVLARLRARGRRHPALPRRRPGLQRGRDHRAGARGRSGRARCWSRSRSWACRPTPATTCSTSARCSTPARRRWATSSTRRATSAAGAGRRPAAAGRAPAVQLRGGGRGRPACSAWCRRAYLPNYGEFYEARQFSAADCAIVDRGRRCSAQQRAVRRRAAVRGRQPAAAALPRRDLRGRVGAGAAVVVRRAGRRHGAGQPVGVERRWSARAATATSWSASSRRAAWRPTCTPRPGVGESTTDMAWDGQALIYENGELLAEARALPRRLAHHLRRRRPRAPVARAHAHRPPSASRCAAMPTKWRSSAWCASSCAVPRDGALPLARTRRALPVCAGRSGAARRALHRGVQHPGAGAGAAAVARAASRRS